MPRTTPSKLPPAPDHLRPDVAAWWDAVVIEFDLEPHQLAQLEVAADALHRLRDARQIVLDQGATVPDRYGVPKVNPAANVERDSRSAFFAALRSLNLEDAAPPMSGRTPARGGSSW